MRNVMIVILQMTYDVRPIQRLHSYNENSYIAQIHNSIAIIIKCICNLYNNFYLYIIIVKVCLQTIATNDSSYLISYKQNTKIICKTPSWFLSTKCKNYKHQEFEVFCVNFSCGSM